MRVIVAGTRYVESHELVARAILDSGFDVTLLVSGGQITYRDGVPVGGVDWLGECWALDRGLPIKRYFAQWGRYGRRAGPIRNKLMSENADALVAVWDYKSRGTRDMIERMRDILRLPTYIQRV